MRITDVKTGEIYYDSSGKEEVFVTNKFWKALLAKEIKYSFANKDEDIVDDEIRTFEVEADDFETIFLQFAFSEIGKAIIAGKMPIDTVG